MELNLNDIYKLIEKNGERQEKLTERLFLLVEKSVAAVEKSNGIGEETNRVLGGVKRTNWLDFVTKLFSYVVVVLFLLLVAFAIQNGTPLKYGDLEVNMSPSE